MSPRASDYDDGDARTSEIHAVGDGGRLETTRQGLRQRLRRDGGARGEDLFLSLALNEADLNG